MKKLFVTLICLCAAIWIGFLIHRDAGYILIGYHGYTIETSLWIGIFLALLIWLTAHVLWWSVKKTLGVGHQLHQWSQHRQSKNAREKTYEGLRKLAEGEWPKAENLLSKSAEHSPSPLINHLGCAYAMQAQSLDEKRDHYLRQASESTPHDELAVGLTQAILQMNSQQLEQALATLNHLIHLYPKHRFTLKLLSETLQQLHDWESLESILPNLDRQNVLTSEQLADLTQSTYIGRLKQLEQQQDLNQIKQWWETLPRRWRDNEALIQQYALSLITLHDHQAAMNIIVMSLRRTWRPALLEVYRHIDAADSHQQLTVAENWLKQHTGQPELQLCVAELCLRNDLLARAEHLLNEYNHHAPSRVSYHLLGMVYKAMGHSEQAVVALEKALSFNQND